jgi:hypothetical protein
VAVDRRAAVRWDARVPDYDAFGREIGEDPLANLRNATRPAPEPRAEPAPERTDTRVEAAPESPSPAAEAVAAPVLWPDPEPVAARTETPAEVAPPPEPARSPRWGSAPTFVRPRRRGRAGFAGLIVLVAGIGAIGLVGNSAVEKGQEIIDSIELPTTPEVDDAGPPPVGLQARSLIRADNFSAALEQLQGTGFGRPTTIRIAPDRINATLIADGRIHSVQIDPGGELRDFGEAAGSGKPIAYKAIDPAAPGRLVRASATGKHPVRSIDYVLINAGPPATGAYFKGGRIVLGDRHGKPQRVTAD